MSEPPVGKEQGGFRKGSVIRPLPYFIFSTYAGSGECSREKDESLGSINRFSKKKEKYSM